MPCSSGDEETSEIFGARNVYVCLQCANLWASEPAYLLQEYHGNVYCSCFVLCYGINWLIDTKDTSLARIKKLCTLHSEMYWLLYHGRRCCFFWKKWQNPYHHGFKASSLESRKLPDQVIISSDEIVSCSNTVETCFIQASSFWIARLWICSLIEVACWCIWVQTKAA